ncbi:FAD-binding Berberine family protein [Striga asiatica]|uniref:FAD-binding Berberine family protein n=1 Tax=Striga asiatica TaxID=4170 RepID=A0A5A7P909_STRAF|nr:FAD-binding Berberine family protein [Striga asiatica]
MDGRDFPDLAPIVVVRGKGDVRAVVREPLSAEGVGPAAEGLVLGLHDFLRELCGGNYDEGFWAQIHAQDGPMCGVLAAANWCMLPIRGRPGGPGGTGLFVGFLFAWRRLQTKEIHSIKRHQLWVRILWILMEGIGTKKIVLNAFSKD